MTTPDTRAHQRIDELVDRLGSAEGALREQAVQIAALQKLETTVDRLTTTAGRLDVYVTRLEDVEKETDHLRSQPYPERPCPDLVAHMADHRAREDRWQAAVNRVVISLIIVAVLAVAGMTWIGFRAQLTPAAQESGNK